MPDAPHVKDEELAEEVEAIETRNGRAGESRKRIFQVIRAKYTSPA